MVEQLTVIDPQTRVSEFAGGLESTETHAVTGHSNAVQETILRAWQHADEFEGRASLRTWLYKIATNICLDMKRAPQRRCLPLGLSGPGQVPNDPTILATRSESTWVGPIADSNLAGSADIAVVRESIGWPSSPCCRCCHLVSAWFLSCAMCWPGRPRSVPTCWTRRSTRSTRHLPGHARRCPNATRSLLARGRSRTTRRC